MFHIRHIGALMLLLLATVSCSDEVASTPPDSGQPPTQIVGDLPCDIAEVLQAQCGDCHSEAPLYGAPMPLVSYADLFAAAPSDPDRAVWELISERVGDTDSPMPPSPREMDAVDRDLLIAWAERGAPARAPDAEACNPLTPPPIEPDVGPDALPCEPSHVLTAHGPAGDDDAYEVPVESDSNTHTCFAFRSPFAPGEQATAWAPVIDNARILHHYIVWGSNSPPPGGGGSFPCETLPSPESSFVLGWAPGGENNVLPEDVGLVLDYEWLYLQVHYYNPAGEEGLQDRSGVAICSTPTPRTHAAGVLAFGTIEIDVPARARDHVEAYTCPGYVFSYLGDFTILGSSPHMHTHGTRFLSEVVRSDGSRVEISRVDNWDFNNQTSFPRDPPITIRGGDGVRVTCTYNNPSDRAVRFGENTDDEMCFDFMLVYPITNWPADTPRFCVNIERFL